MKLNLTAGVDAEIYVQENRRLTDEMEDLRRTRSIVTQAEIERRETLRKVHEVTIQMNTIGW